MLARTDGGSCSSSDPSTAFWVVGQSSLLRPVQVLAVGLDNPEFGEARRVQLTRRRGIVRLIDLMLVSRAEDGGLELPPATRFRPASAPWPLVSAPCQRRTRDRHGLEPSGRPPTSRRGRGRWSGDLVAGGRCPCRTDRGGCARSDAWPGWRQTTSRGWTNSFAPRVGRLISRNRQGPCVGTPGSRCSG